MSFLVFDSELFSNLIRFEIKSESSKHPKKGQESHSSESVVTVIRDDDQEFQRSYNLYVEEFLQEHPGNAICHAKTLLHKRLCRVLCPRMYLLCGETYVMLSMNRNQSRGPQNQRALVTKRTSGGQQQGSVIPRKFVITRQQLGNILLEGSPIHSFTLSNERAAEPSSQASTPSQGPHQGHLNQTPTAKVRTCYKAPGVSRRRRTVRSSPKLPSIPEMPMNHVMSGEIVL